MHIKTNRRCATSDADPPHLKRLFVCLAAGRGRRMAPLTNYIHKAMVPFSGLPFLAYSLFSIPEGAKVIIVVHHLREQIMSYFGNRYKGKSIRYMDQRHLLGTGDALFKIGKKYKPTNSIIVWLADQLIFPEDVKLIQTIKTNAVLCSHADKKFQDIGIWNIEADTLQHLKDHFANGEFRALPVLIREGAALIKVPRNKIELSLETWKEVEQICNAYKHKFVTGCP